MALPQQVIDRLSHESPKTPGWSYGLILFSGGVLLITLLVYFGLTLGYEPYLDSQIANLNTQIDTTAKSISPTDQAQLIAFYSEISNIKSVLGKHVTFSHFFAWLEKNTEANVYYSHLAFATGNQVSLSGFAVAEADVNQQMAIFENAPEVKSVTLSGVSLMSGGTLWSFNMLLTMNPSGLLTP